MIFTPVVDVPLMMRVPSTVMVMSAVISILTPSSIVSWAPGLMVISSLTSLDSVHFSVVEMVSPFVIGTSDVVITLSNRIVTSEIANFRVCMHL